jgi:hypothetical protein
MVTPVDESVTVVSSCCRELSAIWVVVGGGGLCKGAKGTHHTLEVIVPSTCHPLHRTVPPTPPHPPRSPPPRPYLRPRGARLATREGRGGACLQRRKQKDGLN